ncbi:nuclear transport factor 2 family protein [Occultella kanbiaonis]|uniref:nuclear transport factor 2 family protein n=1 Tax=Occultella kanbiaonis TaxID=2675754 RepID=UPI0013D743D1|nr:nuclear transport factor 2 family protein [Occultella kanbiaonis]
MSSAQALVRRHVDSFNAGDAETLLSDFTSDASWVTGDYTVPGGELREFFRSAMASITPRLDLVRVVDGGSVVVAELTESWTHDGEAKRAALVAVFDLVEGRIARAKIYREGSADA